MEGGLLNGHIAAPWQSGAGEHSLALSKWVVRAAMFLPKMANTALRLVHGATDLKARERRHHSGL